MANPIRIVKFWTTYQPKPDGTTEAIDRVEYCAPGMAQRTTTTATVRSLSRLIPNVDPDNIAAAMAKSRWEAIEPAYNAWKAGQEAPTNGTPLAAWPGVSPEQAEVMRTLGLRTVEDVAGSTDTVISRVQLPGVRELQQNAKRFLAARDNVAVASQMGALEAAMQIKDEQLEEMRQIMLAMQARMEDLGGEELAEDGGELPSPARRGPGRPRKVVHDEAAA